MKKYFLITICLLTSFIIKGQEGHVSYPNYTKVVTTFFSKYSIKELDANSYIRFEKRPTGWFLVVIDYTKKAKILRSEQIWDAKTNKFKTINFPKIAQDDENQENINSYLSVWIEDFNFCPYYGYVGWQQDIIKDFGDKQNLPDSTYYALGRAYSTMASEFFNDLSYFPDTTQRFNLAQGKNALSEEQLKKYRYYRHKAIEIFNALAKSNPKYETIVGSIGVKASNEYMTSYLDLRTLQNIEEARKELIDGQYNEFFISMAKNYLSSCAQNAILFASGDNDFFPLIYAQEKLGFRRDVTVISFGLLQSGKYINSIREPLFDTPGILLSLSPKDVEWDKSEVALIGNIPDSSMSFSEVINFFKNNLKYKSDSNSEYVSIPTNKFYLKEQDNKVEFETKEEYIYRGNLILLDILASNNWNRPVYFSSKSDINCAVIADYTELHGAAYRLKSKKMDDLQNINTTILYDNLMNKFNWQGMDKAYSSDKIPCLVYRSSFNSLAEALIREHKMDSAKRVLDISIDIISNDIVYFDEYNLNTIKEYYILKCFDKGNSIAKVLVNNLKNNKTLFSDIRYISHDNDIQSVLKELTRIAEEYNQKEIIKLIEGN